MPGWRTASLAGYDAWLERPYAEMAAQELPGRIEDWMGLELELDGEQVTVVDAEAWEDADEDGSYGGWELIVSHADGSRHNVSIEKLETALASR